MAKHHDKNLIIINRINNYFYKLWKYCCEIQQLIEIKIAILDFRLSFERFLRKQKMPINGHLKRTSSFSNTNIAHNFLKYYIKI